MKLKHKNKRKILKIFLLSMCKVNELGLNDEIELISKEHPASQKRYLYVNGQIRLLSET